MSSFVDIEQLSEEIEMPQNDDNSIPVKRPKYNINEDVAKKNPRVAKSASSNVEDGVISRYIAGVSSSNHSGSNSSNATNTSSCNVDGACSSNDSGTNSRSVTNTSSCNVTGASSSNTGRACSNIVSTQIPRANEKKRKKNQCDLLESIESCWKKFSALIDKPNNIENADMTFGKLVEMELLNIQDENIKRTKKREILKILYDSEQN